MAEIPGPGPEEWMSRPPALGRPRSLEAPEAHLPEGDVAEQPEVAQDPEEVRQQIERVTTDAHDAATALWQQTGDLETVDFLAAFLRRTVNAAYYGKSPDRATLPSHRIDVLKHILSRATELFNEEQLLGHADLTERDTQAIERVRRTL